MTETLGVPVTGPQARFRWERALRSDGAIPWHIKGFLLLVGTYMNGDGHGARPSSARLVDDTGLSRQTVFRTLQHAEALGWLATVKVPGKPSERRPSVPATSHMGVTGQTLDPDLTRHTERDGYPSHERDGSYGEADITRHTHVMTPVTPVRPNRNKTGTTGGAPPPDPRRDDPPQAPGRNDQPAPDSRTGTEHHSAREPGPPPARTGTRARPLLAIVQEPP